MKRIVTVIVMAAAILVAVPSFPVGAARVPDLQCGVNPTTSVRLRADLTCSERFQIQAGTPPITIDLDGHTLTFTDRTCLPGPPISRCDITDSSGGLTITHGTVAGSLSLGQNATSAHPVQVLKVHVTDPVDTWGPVAVTHSVLDGKVSSFGAISLEHNTLRGGVKISDQLAGTPIDIVDNTIVGSPGAGIEVSVVFDFDRVGGTIAGNDIRTSAGAGIDIHGMGSNGLGALDIVNNHLTSNGGDGISYAQDNRFPERFGMGPVMVTNNTARSNGGHGINIRDAASGDPATGVFDGGGNTARYNALSPRCIGVVCNTDDRRRPAISWSQPAAIVTGTPLGPDQLNATASVPGTFTYTPVAGTVLDPGGYSLTVRFVPDDLVHYQATTFGVALEVKKFPILPPP